MSVARNSIGRERRRQMQIRHAFESALATGGDEMTDFYLSAAAYIVLSMDRLHSQDQMIHDFLCERIDVQDTDAARRLAELNARQQESRGLVEDFQRATARFARVGPDGVAEFEAAAREFSGSFNSLMAPRKNPFQAYTDELFTDEDWQLIAGVSDESEKMEAELFRAVQVNVPLGVEPVDADITYH
jgi:hypothetical protein